MMRGEDVNEILDNLKAIHGEAVAQAADVMSCVLITCYSLSAHQNPHLCALLATQMNRKVAHLAKLNEEQTKAAEKAAVVLGRKFHAA